MNYIPQNLYGLLEEDTVNTSPKSLKRKQQHQQQVFSIKLPPPLPKKTKQFTCTLKIIHEINTGWAKSP